MQYGKRQDQELSLRFLRAPNVLPPMARSKPSSPKARRPPVLAAAIRPNVRASIPLPASSFEVPILVNGNLDVELVRHDQVPRSQLAGSNPPREQSTGSLLTSRSTTRTSSSSARLDVQRRLSTVLTPTSSEASQSEQDASSTHATLNIAAHGRRAANYRHLRATEQGLPSIDETLAGQGRWVPVHIDAVQDVEFVNTGPAPGHLVAQDQSPWSGLHQPADAISTSPTGSDVNRGGRKGGLGKEKATKVGGMRNTRACLRCFVYRIECDESEPCAPCRKRMRTWRLGCTRRRLPERLDILLPDILTAHLEFKKVCSFINTNAEMYRGPTFHLPLTQFLGQRGPLWIPVREIAPLGSKLIQSRQFTINDERIVETLDLDSLPVVPYWPPKRTKEEIAQIEQTLMQWLRGIAHTERSDWQGYVFPRKKVDVYLWERNILGQICYLLDPSKPEHEQLEAAMELTFFNYIQIHAFVVPPDQFKYVYNKLQNPAFSGHRPAPNDEVCSRAVNAFLAMLTMHKFKLLAAGTLEHLNFLFADRKSTVEIGVLAFCESFLFLLVLAQLQKSVLENTMMEQDDEATNFSKDDAVREIKRMEDELAIVIIELCVFKLRKVAKKLKAEERGAEGDDIDMGTQRTTSQFFDRLHKITVLCGKFLYSCRKAQKLMRPQVGA